MNIAAGGSGTIVANTGSLVAGNGTFRGHGYIRTGSTLLPGKLIPGQASQLGAMQWDGALEIDAASKLSVQIGGTTAGTQHDRINISGAFTLNGQLAVSFVNGYGSTVSPADVFDVAVSDVSITSPLNGTRVSALGSYGTLLVSIVNNGKTLRLSNFQAGPANYASWVLRHGLTGPAAEWGSDPFSSGFNNLLKYALGLDPTKAGGTGPTVGIVQEGSERYLSLSYTKPTGADLPTDLVYTVERASAFSPTDWSSSIEHVVPAEAPVAGPGILQTVTVRSTHPIGSGPREFLRLRVTRN